MVGVCKPQRWWWTPDVFFSEKKRKKDDRFFLGGWNVVASDFSRKDKRHISFSTVGIQGDPPPPPPNNTESDMEVFKFGWEILSKC